MQRMTDTEKWSDRWFKKLADKEKLLWLFILDNCDYAGVWEVDKDLVELRLGKIKWDEVLERFCVPYPNADPPVTRIIVLESDEGEEWLVSKFIGFQFKKLKDEEALLSCTSSYVKLVATTLKKHNLSYTNGITYPIGYAIPSKYKNKYKKEYKYKNKGEISDPLEAYPLLKSELGNLQQIILDFHGIEKKKTPAESLRDSETLEKLARLDKFSEQDIAGCLKWLFTEYEPRGEFSWKVNVGALAPLRGKCKNGLTKFQSIYNEWKKPSPRSKSQTELGLADSKYLDDEEIPF